MMEIKKTEGSSKSRSSSENAHKLASSLLLFWLLATVVSAELQGLQSLSHGDSLAAEKEEDFLISHRGTFSSGFFIR